MLAARVAAQRNDGWVLAKQQNIRYGVSFARLNQIMLQLTCGAVPYSAQVDHQTVCVALIQRSLLAVPLLTTKLEINRETSHGIECVAHRLPYSWMRVDRRRHVVERRLESDCRDRLGDDFGRERPDRVNA